jgi:Uma2 family endonuclease
MSTPHTETTEDEQSAPLPTFSPEELRPNTDHIATEDDTPVDTIRSEKQQRLLTEPLYSSRADWIGADRSFLAAANVGDFATVYDPPLVPDVFVSLDVRIERQPWEWKKHQRTYFIWEFGKPPDIAIEIVSNRKGGESQRKFASYARMRFTYYVIFDPEQFIQDEPLRCYELRENSYAHREHCWFAALGLGLRLWEGRFEEQDMPWLRWCDQQGTVLPTGAERAARAEQERDQTRQQLGAAQQQLDAVQQARDLAEQRAAQLAARLRELGIDPEQATDR